MNKYLISLALLAAFALPSFSALAEQEDERGRRGPPPEALAACEGLAEGDACSFTVRDDEQLQGTCMVARDDQTMCRPEGMEGQGPGGQGQGDRPRPSRQ